MEKNRDREAPTFANINLLGKCNADCYFCLGKDLEGELKGQNHCFTHHDNWKNFSEFLDGCKEEGITKLYITGQNVDSLQYVYLFELICDLRDLGFGVGLRTNGYLALDNMTAINSCTESVGYTVHSYYSSTVYKTLGRYDIPPWRAIFSKTKHYRVSIPVTRYNYAQVFAIIEELSTHNPRYVQLRRISTDRRGGLMWEDWAAYDRLVEEITGLPRYAEPFHRARRHLVYGVETVLWPTVATSVNSWNYFTDGTISREYFIVKGYLKSCERLQSPKQPDVL